MSTVWREGPYRFFSTAPIALNRSMCTFSVTTGLRSYGCMMRVLRPPVGRVLGTPIRWYSRLERANAAQRQNWELLARGEGIHWPDVDEDLSLEGMLAGRAAPGVVK